jgi:Ca-activated chloride channel family protein
MPSLPRLEVFFALLLALTLLAAPPAAATDAGSDGPAIVVLDGSGSMWGVIGIERPSKFDLARVALRDALATISPRVRLGLMSFGQRRRADCSDVEIVAPPEGGAADRIPSFADKLNPKGKGPLALALREAAKQVPADQAGSIIVIHDGMDNCAQDPCAAAAEIAKSNPRTRLFMIGFGLEKSDLQRLQCVVPATNGAVFNAQDSASLASALSEAMTLANLERVDPTTGVAVPVPKAAPAPNPAGAPGLRLSASLAADGDPLAAAFLTVSKADEPGTPVLKTFRGRELAIDLKPGSYVVEGRFGQASARQTVEVAANEPTVVRLSLGAGLLKLTARADKNGTPLTNPFVTISAKDAAAGGALRPIWVGREADLEMVFPAGAYQVQVRDGLAEQTADVTITEGAASDLAPVLGNGRLELSAVSAANGEALRDVSYTIDEDDPDAPQGRREVARSADPTASFTLPSGTYYVTARSGVAETRDRIALGSGGVIKHVASFNLVELTVTAKPAGGSASDPILIRVLGDGQDKSEIARARGATGVFLLPPARYRVEAQVSGLNIKTLGLVDLSNGRGGSVQLALESCEVSIGASGTTGRHWRVKDGTGRTVMHSGPGMATSARLAPGRYVLLTDTDDQRIEQAFELKAGERRELALGNPSLGNP